MIEDGDELAPDIPSLWHFFTRICSLPSNGLMITHKRRKTEVKVPEFKP